MNSAFWLLFIYSILITIVLLTQPEKSEPSIFRQKNSNSVDCTEIEEINKLSHITRIIQQKQPKIKLETAEEIAKAVQIQSDIHKFPEELILSIIETESTFKPKAVSKSNCKGLMQIKESMHPEKIHINANIFDINANISIGCQILAEYYQKTGSIKQALYRYRGKKSNYYVSQILSNFTDLMIKKIDS